MMKNTKKLLIMISLILFPMLSIAQTGVTIEKRLTIETLLPAGTVAPYDGILVPEKNYRIYNEAIDQAEITEQKYDSAKSKDMWKNIGIGFLAGFAVAIMTKH